MKAAYQEMETRIRQQVPGAQENGIYRAADGSRRSGSPAWSQAGPSIRSGNHFRTGGIYTELWKDIAYGLAPLRREEAEQMIRKTKVYEIIKGFRGREPLDEALLVTMLLRLSQLMEDVTGNPGNGNQSLCGLSAGGAGGGCAGDLVIRVQFFEIACQRRIHEYETIMRSADGCCCVSWLRSDSNHCRRRLSPTTANIAAGGRA